MKFIKNKKTSQLQKIFIWTILLATPIFVIEGATQVYYQFCTELSWQCPKCQNYNWKSHPPYTCGRCGHKVG